jgi:hypothetical protein
MTTWAVRTEQEREQVIKIIRGRDLPFTINATKGAPRSIDQNKLQRKWLTEAEQQGDCTAEEYRAYCKLHGGVPILRAENDQFHDVYDRVIRPLPYEQKLEIMKVPIDMPVTRIMTTSQKSKYLDWMYAHFTGLGFTLTEPKGMFDDQQIQIR